MLQSSYIDCVLLKITIFSFTSMRSKLLVWEASYLSPEWFSPLTKLFPPFQTYPLFTGSRKSSLCRPGSSGSKMLCLHCQQRASPDRLAFDCPFVCIYPRQEDLRNADVGKHMRILNKFSLISNYRGNFADQQVKPKKGIEWKTNFLSQRQ